MSSIFSWFRFDWFTLLAFTMFIIGFTSFLTAGFIYLKKRFVALLPFQKKTKKHISILLFVMIYSSMVMMPLRLIENKFSDFLYWFAFISLGTAHLLLVLTLFRDLILLSLFILRKIQLPFASGSIITDKKKVSSTEETPRDSTLSRKEFFIKASHKVIVSASVGLTTHSLYQARKVANLTPVRVPLKNLPKNFDGFKITQITDIHVGPTIKRSYVEAIVDAVNSTKPDLVAITGDLVDGSVDALYSHVEPLKNLRSKYGSYFVTGNHEYYSGAEAWVEALRNLGINVLMNEHVVLTKNKSHLILAGVTDYRAYRILPEHKTDPAKAIRDCKVDGCKIILAHQPRSIYKVAEAGYDLQISGHTHGGQLFPYNFFIHLIQPFVEGLHRYKNTWIYVNRGTGYWGIPMRLGAPSEIAEITLQTI